MHAKETHFEKVKFELLDLYLQCTTCHADAKGQGLTRYGQRLVDMGKETALRERVKRMERRVSAELAQSEPGAENDRVDIDGDGVLNWVEILCGTDPSDRESRPGGVAAALPPDAQPSEPPSPAAAQVAGESATPSLRARVEKIVDCRLCHTSVEKRGAEEDAPHNAFGELIAKLDPPPPQSRPGSVSRAAPPKPEPSDFLTRFRRVANQDLDRDKARNWEEIATFHAPWDKSDAPSPEELEALKQRLLLQRQRESGFGKAHPE